MHGNRLGGMMPQQDSLRPIIDAAKTPVSFSLLTLIGAVIAIVASVGAAGIAIGDTRSEVKVNSRDIHRADLDLAKIAATQRDMQRLLSEMDKRMAVSEATNASVAQILNEMRRSRDAPNR